MQTRRYTNLRSFLVIAYVGLGLADYCQGTGNVAVWGYYYDLDIPETYRSMCAFNHCLALKSDGTVVEWGDFSTDSTIPTSGAPPGLSNVVSIACGYHHNLALKEDGTVVAWGAGT